MIKVFVEDAFLSSKAVFDGDTFDQKGARLDEDNVEH